jgi:hypothetical protein
MVVSKPVAVYDVKLHVTNLQQWSETYTGIRSNIIDLMFEVLRFCNNKNVVPSHRRLLESAFSITQSLKFNNIVLQSSIPVLIHV